MNANLLKFLIIPLCNTFSSVVKKHASYAVCIILFDYTHSKNVVINRVFKEGYVVSTIQRLALALTIIGAINWGLIGFFQFDLVAAIFGGQDSAVSRIIYGLVGIAGLINLGLLFKPWKEMETSAEPGTTR
jgi:uncharacterized membrane protein YuzA (DUF378 family)